MKRTYAIEMELRLVYSTTIELEEGQDPHEVAASLCEQTDIADYDIDDGGWRVIPIIAPPFMCHVPPTDTTP